MTMDIAILGRALFGHVTCPKTRDPSTLVRWIGTQLSILIAIEQPREQVIEKD
jgi:hypothetical protein